MSTAPIYLWGSFAALVVLVLSADVGMARRYGRAAATSLRAAALFTGFVVALTLAFNGLIAWQLGREAGLQFLTGYIVEEALSIDNLFVFLLIFKFFHIPVHLQHRVLFWGIFGAFVLRGAFIAAGVALVAAFAWVFYLFGAFLLATGIKLWFADDGHSSPEASPIVRLYRRCIPSTSSLHGDSFTVVQDGRRLATPLLLVLVLVELSDIMFAVDSIPAIFAVTTDPFLVYTSNICAILGLRSLYFLLAGVLQRFVYLRYGLSLVLGFIGAKMLLHSLYPIGTATSLAVIFACLGATLLASLWAVPRKDSP